MRTIFFLFIFSLYTSLWANEAPVVVQINVDDDITDVMADYIADGIADAEKQNAEAVIIQMNTPGGVLESTRNIVQTMLGANIPVIVFVGPAGSRAGSAGVFITLASNIAAMAPSTNIGAAHPVNYYGSDIEGDMRKKIENDAAAWARALSESKNRNAQWAEKAVLDSASISEVEALKLKVIDYIAKDVPDLLAKINGKIVLVDGQKRVLHTENARIEIYKMSKQQEMVKLLSDPDVLFFLMVLGFLCLFLEFQMPGLSFPGIFGALCLITVFGIQFLPINWLGVFAIFGSIALFITEIYVVSFGLLSLSGLALFVFGSFLLFDVPGSSMQVNAVLIWVFAGIILVLFLVVGYLLVRAKNQGPISGSDLMIGKTAEVYEQINLDKPGIIYFQGSYWQASADYEIAAGTLVEIVRMESIHAFVKKLNK
ncbi:MAG: nodulation protein NfeD [bacterium]|nr:nodulation protein NfeD [bacterium]